MTKLAAISCAILTVVAMPLVFLQPSAEAVEIPLEGSTSNRVGFVDMQKVFDTYPAKSFAEGDLLKEISQRRRTLSQRQAFINTLRRQISLDEAAYAKASQGQAVLVPQNVVPNPESPGAATPNAGTPAALPVAAVATSTPAATPVEPYPTEDPISASDVNASSPTPSAPPSPVAALPGMQRPSEATKSPSAYPLLETLSGTSTVTLSAEALAQLQKRITDHRRRLDQETAAFMKARQNSIADMKQLQTEKTYGVMAEIYAVLQEMARDENIAVVLDKAYVLYGEEGIDLSDRLIARMREGQGL